MELKACEPTVFTKIRYHMVFCNENRKKLLNNDIANFLKTYALRLVKDTLLNLMQLAVTVIMYIFLLELSQKILLQE